MLAANDNLRPGARWRAAQEQLRDDPWFRIEADDGVLQFPPCGVQWCGFLDPPTMFAPDAEIRAFIDALRGPQASRHPYFRRAAAEAEGCLRDPLRRVIFARAPAGD